MLSGTQAGGEMHSFFAPLSSDGAWSVDSSVKLSEDWTLSLWIFVTSGDSPKFEIKDNSGNQIVSGNASSASAEPLTVLPTHTSQWTHVTLLYKHRSSSSGKIYLRYNDRDFATNQPVTPSYGNTAGYAVHGTNDASTGYKFGIVGGDGKVGLNSFSEFANTSASVSLFDETLQKKIVDTKSTTSSLGSNGTIISSNTANSVVYSGDDLTLTYKFSFDSTSTLNTALTLVMLKASQIQHVNWDETPVEIKVNGKNSDTTTVNDLSKSYIFKNSINIGDTVEFVLKGKAGADGYIGTVSQEPFMFYNGGAEAYMDTPILSKMVSEDKSGTVAQLTTPSFTIKPGITSTHNVTVTDKNIRTNKDAGKVVAKYDATTESTKTYGRVFAGDELTYDFQINYDPDKSAIDWSNIKAKITAPSSNFTPSSYQVKYGDGSAKSISNGDSVSTLSKDNASVDIIVTGTVNSSSGAVGAANVTLSSTDPQHSESADAPQVQVVPDSPTTKQDFQLVIATPSGTSQANPYQLGTNIEKVTSNAVEDAKGFTISGNVIDPSPVDNATLTYVVSVNGEQKVTVQLPSNTAAKGHFKFRFIKPGHEYDESMFTDSLNAAWSASPSAEIQTVTIGQLDKISDINQVTIQAINEDGQAASVGGKNSGTVYVKPGTLSMSVSDISFKDDLRDQNGKASDIAPTEKPSVVVTNTLLADWNIDVTLSKQITDDETGEKLAGSLFYSPSATSNFTQMYDLSSEPFRDDEGNLTEAPGQTADISGTAADNDAQGKTDVTKEWSTDISQFNLTKQSGQSSAKGMFLHLYGNAKEGTYTGELTWTLSNTPSSN